MVAAGGAALLAAIGAAAPAAAAGHAAAAAGHGPALPGAARQAPVPIGAGRRAPLPAGDRYVCPAPARAGVAECMAIVRTIGPRGSLVSPATPFNGFYSPAQLRAAYRLTTASARSGLGRTVAIVDAFSDPHAASDLATYRARFHLGACGVAAGCLRIVNEHGRRSPLPRPDPVWAGEESVDLDMVSAICPRCRILLVESSSPTFADFGVAENTAVALGAKFVSNSWAGLESASQDRYDRFFNHPGIVIDFASGDFGYSPSFPGDLQFVTSVGGTSLRHASGGRGWAESVWGSRVFGALGTGGGCSAIEAKPSWQLADATAPDGCLNRTLNDVAADGNPATGAAVYDTYPSPDFGPGWNEFGGTSVATPIVTATYALAGAPAPRTYPAQYPYSHPGGLFNVATGTNGTCESYRRYLCHGGPGYNSPAGLGTPDGTASFTADRVHRVTVPDPGTADLRAGGMLSLRLAALDTATATPRLRWSATGLPAGLSIYALGNTTHAMITGTVRAPAGSYVVTARASDGAVAGTTRFSVVVVDSLRTAGVTPGRLGFTALGLCADAGSGAAGQPVTLRRCDRSAAAQGWVFRAAGGPGAFGALVTDGRCLAITGHRAVLARCDGGDSERFGYLGLGALRNTATGDCLAARTLHGGTRLDAAPCDFTRHRRFQSWRMPDAPLVSAAGLLCLTDPGGTSRLGEQARAAACDHAAAQRWSMTSTGTIRSTSGYCLDGGGSTVLTSTDIKDGTKVVLNFCNGRDLHQDWLPGPAGELVNRWSGRCLAEVPGSGQGTGLVEEDCYGSPREIWGLN